MLIHMFYDIFNIKPVNCTHKNASNFVVSMQNLNVFCILYVHIRQCGNTETKNKGFVIWPSAESENATRKY